MRQRDLCRLKVGDTIKVKTWHGRVGRRTVIRKIVALDDDLGVGIRMFGWDPFWLRKKEIIKKIRINDQNRT